MALHTYVVDGPFLPLHVPDNGPLTDFLTILKDVASDNADMRYYIYRRRDDIEKELQDFVAMEVIEEEDREAIQKWLDSDVPWDKSGGARFMFGV